MFAYEYATTADPLQTQTASFDLQITLSCLGSINGATTLTVTEAQASDPAFGCTTGCEPRFGSVALLRAEPPTTPSNPSMEGEGLVILFPNGSTLVTANGPGAMTISSDGRILSNSLDPGLAGATWSARTGSGACIPVDDRGSCTLIDSGFNTTYDSWTLNQSAL
jgi:hypothetical protein